jgi:hypothetical protein
MLLDTAKGYLEDPQLRKVTDQLYGNGSADYFAHVIYRYYGV